MKLEEIVTIADEASARDIEQNREQLTKELSITYEDLTTILNQIVVTSSTETNPVKLREYISVLVDMHQSNTSLLVKKDVELVELKAKLKTYADFLRHPKIQEAVYSEGTR